MNGFPINTTTAYVLVFVWLARLFQSSSRERQSHLESLHDFVSQATQELIWLNEKEEEEVAFDWSDRNINISKKRDYHAVSLCLLKLVKSSINNDLAF